MTVTGWPLRAGRAAYGAFDMRDERPTVNSEEEFNAAQANLSFWQMGALGLIAPKAVMQWAPVDEAPAKLLHGSFAWDQTTYADVALGSLPSYIASYVVNSLGDYTLTFNNSTLGRPDGEGIPQTEVLAFQFAWADVNLESSGARGFANVTMADAQTFNIEITRAGIPSGQIYCLAIF